MIEGDTLLRLLAVYLLVALRFTGMMSSSPAFVASSLPLPLRFWGAAIISVMAVGGLDLSLPAVTLSGWLPLVLAAIREFLIGVLIGFISGAPFYALQMSGRLIGTRMGLAMVSVLDPVSQTQVSIIGQLQFLVGLWFFMYWNGHLILAQSVLESLKLIPLGQIRLFLPSDMGLGKWLQDIFVLSFKLAIPYYGALLLADVGLGFLARTVPQMNIFVLGLPLKIGLGLVILMIVLPVTVDVIHATIDRYLELAVGSSLFWR